LLLQKGRDRDSGSLRKLIKKEVKVSLEVLWVRPELVTQGKGRLYKCEMIYQIGIRGNVRCPKETEKFSDPPSQDLITCEIQ